MIKHSFIFFTLCFITANLTAHEVNNNSNEEIHSKIERPMVVIIPSYNNKNWYQKNLDSIVNQNYTNFTILYVDDCSTDGTGKLVETYIKERKLDHKIKLIKNDIHRGACANWYYAIHSCQDHHIIINVDGDDWLLHENVLNIVNEAYADSNVWLTYGDLVFCPDSGKEASPCRDVPSRVIHSNSFREFEWFSSHLRTFYAWLFKQIRLEDLLYQGNFFPMSCDQAIMFPMIEMCGERIKFIKEKLYVYNRANPIGDGHVNNYLCAHLGHYVRHNMPKYKRLAGPILSAKK